MAERPLPTIIGPTENTLRALLAKTLSPTAIRSYEEWVYLNLTAAGSSLTAISAALRIPEHRVEAIADELVERGLLRTRTELSESGRAELAIGRKRVTQTTELLTTGIDPQHLQICGQVLDRVRATAESLLSDAVVLDQNHSPGHH